MRLRHHVAKIGHLAHLPQELDRGGRGGEAPDVGMGGQRLERGMVVGVLHAHELLAGRAPLEALQQRARRAVLELVVAPEQRFQRGEAMALHGVHQRGVEGAEIGGGAEGAVLQVAAGAAGDLRELGGVERARAAAVELAQPREGDVVDVEVEPHADGVGGDEVVDLAGLEERHLGVARARRERAEHHRRAAALARAAARRSRRPGGTENATTALRGGRRASFSAPGVG